MKRFVKQRKPMVHNILKTLTLVSAMVILGACSSFSKKDNIDPPSELVKFSSTVSPSKAWAVSAGNGNGSIIVGLTPYIQGDYIYSSDYKGNVISLNRDTGKRAWSVSLQKRVSGAVGGGEDKLAVGTLDGEVILLDAENGEVLWTAQVSSEIITSPVIADDRVIVRSHDGRVFGLELNSGKRSWVYDSPVPLLTMRGNAEVIARAGIAVIPFDSGKITGIRIEDGVIQWEKLISEQTGRNELERLVDLDGKTGIVATTVYTAGYNGSTAALSLNSGRLEWSNEISSGTGVSVARSKLYASTDNGIVRAMSRETGTTLWEQKGLKFRGLTTPIQFDDYVVVGDFEGYLHWMDSETGRFVARTRIDSSGISTAPQQAGGRLYVQSNKGLIVAYDIDN